ncbi:MAG: DUF2281 domain-containing protein, partial [Pseudomonadota bacterium]
MIRGSPGVLVFKFNINSVLYYIHLSIFLLDHPSFSVLYYSYFKVTNLPETEKAEVLDFIEYLKNKAGKKERKEWTDFSLSSAMRGMEDE